MTDLMHGRAYRVFTSSNTELVGDCAIVSDEKLVIFLNGLVYVMSVNRSPRRFFASIDDYKNSHSDIAPIAGYCDLHYTEPLTLATLLISLADNSDSYTAEQMLTIVLRLKELFNRN